MPELPDIVVYLEALATRVQGEILRKIRVASPAVLRTYDPPYQSLEGKPVVGLERLGKRLVFEFPEDQFMVIHLMIAGRLQWMKTGTKVPKKVGLAGFDFDGGTLLLTEQGTKKRAGMWVLSGREALSAENRGGIEPLTASASEFAAALTKENRTLKRALTDPTIFSGIGNSYSDEILWAARLSPVARTRQLDEAEIERLQQATVAQLEHWTDLLRKVAGEEWPVKVTAFRPEMAVHGKYGEPCPRCGSPVQRIVYASNETNYCPTCQTGGKVLADRALSRLLGQDWPRTLEELEEMRRRV
ncbi:MAG TPA: DNA-formamidopyrimidine glycosylase family protein [Acidimicrobiia bacterium]|nr:DNA-formamidopyrimidine glycosylase family protein [Acidimicrobiia bacterium]